MSEYQYYEFLAMDRPLNDRELKELRSLSTRADITPTSFVNEYHWGDFRGDPSTLMERYFDAHFYFANWGSRHLMLRLPHRLLDLDTVAEYTYTDLATAWSTDDHVIVSFSGGDEHEDMYEFEWRLSSIIGVRNELANGDLRVLYLSWLLAAQVGMLDDDELEPPVPPGMGSLTASLQGFADFFRIDEDMLAVAAAASQTAQPSEEDQAELARWIDALPVRDKNALLMRVITGEDPHLRTELMREFRAQHNEPDTSDPEARTVGEILDAADARRAQQVRAELARKAEAEHLHAEKSAAERQKRLEWLARNEEPSWQKVNTLIDTKSPAEYKNAVDLLLDLRAVNKQKDTLAEFSRRFSEIRARHQRKVSLIDRFSRAGLH
jgi:hypothetical protein